jgi:chemosensory pili system protein ChpA (sensor histidine kinase/response regulator)
MTQATELLTLFLENFASDSIGGDDIDDLVGQGLIQYVSQVERMATTAQVEGDTGLYHVCVHYQRLLQPLAGCATLAEDVRIALEEWPTLVMTYLEAPDDPDICLALITHLTNPVWVTPLPADEAEALQRLLRPSALPIPKPDELAVTDAVAQDMAPYTMEAACPETPVLYSAVDSEATPSSADQSDTEEEQPLVDDLGTAELAAPEDGLENATATPEPRLEANGLEATMLVPPALTPSAEEILEPPAWFLPEAAADQETTMPALVDLVDAEDAMEAASPGGAPGEDSDNSLAMPADEIPADATLPNPPASTASNVREVTDTTAVYAMHPNEAEELSHYEPDAPFTGADLEATAEDNTLTSTEEEPVPDLPDDSGATADAGETELDETAQSMVELLAQEVMQLSQSLAVSLTEATLESEDWRQVLSDHSEELEHLGDGAEALGLQGLQQVNTQMRTNLLSMITQEETLSNAQRQVILGWSEPVRAYLQRLHDPAAHAALVQYLLDTRWPEPLSASAREALQEALPVRQLRLEEAEPLPPRQQEAQLADIALALPEEVNPQLLEALLQELPQQAADFSAAIQRLTTGTGTLTDVDAARRLAHTLKGAANTVGVPGVANLTHHLEDILLAFAQHETLPTRALSRTLTEAADCLEAMSETLTGMSAPPPEEETLRVLQAVLDWANLIDTEGVPGDDETCPPTRDVLPALAAPPSSPVATDTPTPQARATTATPGTRMAADLVDELLRLTGESMILNGQLQDRLDRTVQQTRTVRSQNAILQQLVWDLEQLVDIRGVTSPLLQRTQEGEFDPLEMEQYNELHTVSRRLLEAITDTLAIGQEVEGSMVSLNDLLSDQRRVQRESEEMIMRTRMVPVKTIAPRLQRSVRQACRFTGKEADLILSGGETLMDSSVLNGMLDPLMHMLRNAVDHGIEAPEQRAAQGKTPTGSITLAFAREGNTIVVRCSDDGAGLDYAAIHRTAVERRLLDGQQHLSEEELGRLILHPGFSTRAHTTQVSGRGIGMDVVATRIQELKGSLSLSSEAGHGCTIEVRLPVSLMSTHGLLVRCGKQVLAISNLGVEQILYAADEVLSQREDKILYRFGEEHLEVVPLETLLNLPFDQGIDSLSQRPALLVRGESGRYRMVLTPAIINSQALVVKGLGRYVPPIRGLAGVTILGDGSATPVIDLPELLGAPLRRHTTAVSPQHTALVADSVLPVALVVDDSLSARRALADFVKDLGFEVHTAGDGLEAVASMERRVPDILLVDLEMPRMNGLELAARVRSHEATRHLPIVMITSRSTEKHRRNAAQAGVDVYLVKPFPEDELAAHIQQLMAPRSAA